MTWFIRYEAPKNARILSVRKTFCGVTVFSDSSNVFDRSWWSCDAKKWYNGERKYEGASSTHYDDVRSFKAFKRHLRKHTELQNPLLDVVLANRYRDCSIHARWVPDGKNVVVDYNELTDR